MSTLFDLTINLNPSADYRRLSVILTLCGVFGLVYADPPKTILVLLICGMIKSLYQVFKDPSPHPNVCTLKFQQQKWIIQRRDGRESEYEKVHICVDTGLFVLLHFSGANRPCFVVIFYDQMSHTALRTLHILHTIL